MLNILQTCFSASWGGLEIQALESSLRLVARGHSVTLACPRGTRLEDESRKAGIPVLALSVRGYLHPSAIRRLRTVLRSRQIDIIHCQLSKDIATVVPAMRLSGRSIPVVLSKRMGSYISKKDILHRFTFSGVRKVIAISEVIRKNVLDTTPVRPEDVVVIHDAIDTRRYSRRPEDRERIRAEFGFTPLTPVVGFVGRFSPGKGQDDLLDALALLRTDLPALRCLIVGEASRDEEEYEREIKSRCTALGLDRTVRFAGYRKDIPAVLAAFDIFVFPSHAEAFGVALIEAMASSLPVVSTNCDGVLDIVVDGTTGLFVDPRSPGQIAEAIRRLAADPALRNSLATAARERAVACFDQQTQTRRIEQLYFELLSA